MILTHALDFANQEGIDFTCKKWMLLQVGTYSMRYPDVFAILFKLILEPIINYGVRADVIEHSLQSQFKELRDYLPKLWSDSSSIKHLYKILIVIDDAHNLGNMDSHGTFFSSMRGSELKEDMRPLLSPMVQGFCRIAPDTNIFSVVPCGTGPSIYNLRSLAESAEKGYQSDLPRSQTSKAGNPWSKYRDTVALFQPIVLAIQLVLIASAKGDVNNNEDPWNTAIDEIEAQLTSAAGKYSGTGNICYDIRKVISTAENNPIRFVKYRNIRTTLELFVLKHQLYGISVELDNVEGPLIEASVGRIRGHELLARKSAIGGASTTVIDEPFVLQAVINYFQQYDDDGDLNTTMTALWKFVDKPSSYVHVWELIMISTLEYIFHNKVLSTTPLGVQAEVYSLLKKEATIVGLDNKHKANVTRVESLDQFLNAHSRGNSKLDGKDVLPFYFPKETPSGPDIVFVLQFESAGYCTVFVQTKLREKFSTEAAFRTVHSTTIDGHIEDDSSLEDYCTCSVIHPEYPETTCKPYIGLVIAYPDTLTEDMDVDSMTKKTRQSQLKPPPKLKQIPLMIDQSNTESVFPAAHMKALQLLKTTKRKAVDDNESQAEIGK
ncbi:hypothetical protein BGZ76_010781 [Entomortierella beljakovae]|nr:hypothetical protein BGZ76_010781 [Entomortierella beljakovae]